MSDIFEQPWVLLIIAILALLVMLMLHRIFPEKRRWWQLALPVFLAVAALGLDWLVQTDLEKINAVINKGIKAVEEENCNAIEAIISDNYSDSYHNTKDDLIYHCRSLLSEPLVEKNKKRTLVIKESTPKATVTLTVLTQFDKKSYVYRDFKPFLLTKMKLDLQKEQDKKWLITRAEILEIDRQPVNWKDIR